MITSLCNFWPASPSRSGPWDPRALPTAQTWRLTTDVEQVREEERLLVEVLYGEDDGSVQAAPQGLLGATFVRDERLKHGPHHVQLERESKMGRSGAGPPSWGGAALCCIYSFLFFCKYLLLKNIVLKKHQFRVGEVTLEHVNLQEEDWPAQEGNSPQAQEHPWVGGPGNIS